MSYISEIFDRINLQQVSSFLQYGTEKTFVSDEPYSKRITDAESEIFGLIRQRFPDIKEQEKFIGDICDYASIIQDVYMEIGLHCGMLLALQLLPLSVKGCNELIP